MRDSLLTSIICLLALASMPTVESTCFFHLKSYEKAALSSSSIIQMFVIHKNTRERKCLPDASRIFLSNNDLISAKINGAVSRRMTIKLQHREINTLGSEEIPFAKKVVEYSGSRHMLIRDAILQIHHFGNRSLIASLQRFIVFNPSAVAKWDLKLVAEIHPKFQHRTIFVMTPTWPGRHFRLTDTNTRRHFDYDGRKDYELVAEHFRWRTSTTTSLKVDLLLSPEWTKVFANNTLPAAGTFPFCAEIVYLYVLVRSEGMMRSFRPLMPSSKAVCIVREDFVSSKFAKARPVEVFIEGTGIKVRYRSFRVKVGPFHANYSQSMDISKAIPVTCCVQYNFTISYCKKVAFKFISKLKSDITDNMKVTLRINHRLAQNQSKVTLNDKIRCVLEGDVTQQRQASVKIRGIYCWNGLERRMVNFGLSGQTAVFKYNDHVRFSLMCFVVCIVREQDTGRDLSKKFFTILPFRKPTIITNISRQHWVLERDARFFCGNRGFPKPRAYWRVFQMDCETGDCNSVVRILKRPRGSSGWYNDSIVEIKISSNPFRVVKLTCAAYVYTRIIIWKAAFRGTFRLAKRYFVKETFTIYLKHPGKTESTEESSIFRLTGAMQVIFIVIVVLFHVWKQATIRIKLHQKSSSVKFKKFWRSTVEKSTRPGSIRKSKSRGISGYGRVRSSSVFQGLGKKSTFGAAAKLSHGTRGSTYQKMTRVSSIDEKPKRIFTEITEEEEDMH